MKKEIAIPIKNTFPQCVGAPLPHIIADDRKTFLFYHISTGNHPYYREHLGQITEKNIQALYVLIEQLNNVKVLDEKSTDYIALVCFDLCRDFKFGGVNDEALSGHPLYKKGLEPYQMHEVKNSSWIKEMNKMNSVHPYHSDKLFENNKHYIFTFHDNTFECIADNYSVQVFKGSVRDVFKIVFEILNK